MNLNEYQGLSKRTIPNMDIKEVSANYAMGLSGEAGEVTDLIKKWIYHGHILDIEELAKELGDVLHYVSGLAYMHGIELEEVAEMNIQKLKERYPNGFSTDASRNRKEYRRSNINV